ncbi:N-acetylmuramate alpha-1-phosphate uridylyltransferase MurU [Thalassotalea crassostreae]|uniref:N-acetylmuramate alpha-1-phosphate uridylyltransferase MurU n=1 Tax=Thalassotalea crassostreae TaxID=1763536 RepID=UPI0008394CED|nr:nucleotidyltransferase family protein [Thalassotalea crassostreae]
MKAMILAAGRGERMKPLTDNCPKPLLKVAGVALIEHHLNNLKAAGITDIVINIAWLGEQIESYFRDGAEFGVQIQYSNERDNALETAGGIVNALPLLGEQPFIIVNGDIYCDYDFSQLQQIEPPGLAHLVMVENPEHNLKGDFVVADGLLNVSDEDVIKYTYSGIGLYDPKLFAGLSVEKLPLAPILIRAMATNSISGSIHYGIWSDVGTPERLQIINQFANQLLNEK